MPKKNSDVARRAWNILRLALLWAHKGGVFKRRLMMDLKLVPKFIKSLGHSNTPHNKINYYFERELSFDKTPIIHVKMNRPASMRFHMPHIPCFNSQVNFDYDFEVDLCNNVACYDVNARKSFLKGIDLEQEEDHLRYEQQCESEIICEEQMQLCLEKNIDDKAEEFIAKFYEQMKLQRQISNLQYNETPKREASSS